MRRASVMNGRRTSVRNEIAPAPRAPARRIFRVKLHGEEISALERGHEMARRDRTSPRLRRRRPAPRRCARNKNRRPAERPRAAPTAALAAADSIPCAAAWRWRQRRDASRENAQAASPGASSLSMKSACKPEADAQKRRAASIDFAQRSGEHRARSSVRINCAEVAHARQDQAPRRRELLPAWRRARFRCPAAPGRARPTADCRRRIRPGKSSSVISALRAGQNALHLRVARGGKTQARANALNSASTWWCDERP